MRSRSPQFLPPAEFGSPTPILSSGSGFNDLLRFGYVISITDPNSHESLRLTQDEPAECFVPEMLKVDLWVCVQGRRPRHLARSVYVFRVFKLAVASGGTDHVR